jgi:hypothetical protein
MVAHLSQSQGSFRGWGHGGLPFSDSERSRHLESAVIMYSQMYSIDRFCVLIHRWPHTRLTYLKAMLFPASRISRQQNSRSIGVISHLF